MKKKHLLFWVLLIQAFALRSHAATVTVTNNGDNVVGGLRFAIANAAAGDTIVFASFLEGTRIILSPVTIVIDKDLVIIGPGEDKLDITTNRSVTLFKIEPSVNVYVSGIQISECSDYLIPVVDDLSGAIYNRGNLTIEHCFFNSNLSGAIYNLGNLSLYRDKFRGNYTLSDNAPGKASCVTNTGNAAIIECLIYENYSDGMSTPSNPIIRNTGDMVIESTSITNNEVGHSASTETGSVYNSGSLQLKNSTISWNYFITTLSNCSGGIYNTGTLRVEYCTIAYNATIDNLDGGYYAYTHKGSGVINHGQLYLKGTLIAQNGLQEKYVEVKGQESYELNEMDGISTKRIHDLGNNLIGINDGLNLKPYSNILGTKSKICDPGLIPLDNNGGFGKTHALVEGSRCIDAGGSSGTVLVDQRGYARNKPDIGAFEYQSIPQVILPGLMEQYSYPVPLNINIEAKVSSPKNHLLVTHVPGYNKLKIGYDNIGLYHANKNVIAGGNDTLEITLKSYYENTEWDKIEIRPNGSTLNPLSLSNYAGHITTAMSEYQTIKIPLSDFDPSIDFSHLIILEFPYSNNAGYFKLGIEKILFTGGTTPFLWFGGTKTDNKFDGTGIGGQLIASLYEEVLVPVIEKVEFYQGFFYQSKFGEDYTDPYTANFNISFVGPRWVRAIAFASDGATYGSPWMHIEVLPSVVRETEYLDYIESNDAEVLENVSVYPNPVLDIVTVKSDNNNSLVVIRDINGSIQYQETYSNLQNGQADISFLPAGLYFLKLEDDENPSGKVFKLIKQ
jgi:hypothetical protein